MYGGKLCDQRANSSCNIHPAPIIIEPYYDKTMFKVRAYPTKADCRPPHIAAARRKGKGLAVGTVLILLAPPLGNVALPVLRKWLTSAHSYSTQKQSVP